MYSVEVTGYGGVVAKGGNWCSGHQWARGGHLPDWVVREGEGQWAWQKEANPVTHPECQWHPLCQQDTQ